MVGDALEAVQDALYGVSSMLGYGGGGSVVGALVGAWRHPGTDVPARERFGPAGSEPEPEPGPGSGSGSGSGPGGEGSASPVVFHPATPVVYGSATSVGPPPCQHRTTRTCTTQHASP